MRALVAAAAVSMLVLGGAPQALGSPIKRSLFRVGVVRVPASTRSVRMRPASS